MRHSTGNSFGTPATLLALGILLLALAGCIQHQVHRTYYDKQGRPVTTVDLKAGSPALPAAAAGVAAQPMPEVHDEDDPTSPGSAASRFGLHFKPVAFDPPRVNRTTLANGITLDHFAEKQLPLVTVLVRLQAGSINDPAGKTGTAGLTAQLVRIGGTAALPGDALDLELERRGATLDASADREETWLRLSVLREDLQWGLGLLAQLTTAPALPAAKLEELRGPKLVELKQRLDAPDDVAMALFPQLIYGQGNPWGAPETPRSIGAIKLADLRQFHQQFYRTGNIKLGISGGIDFEQARALVETSFGKLPAQPYTQPARPAVEPVAANRVYIVPRPVSQNVIWFGHEGIGRFDAMKFPVRVFNNVLAGGFTSRLFNTVRTERGLAYSVYGRIGEGTQRGIYFNMAMTKVESTSEALHLMREINRGLTAAPPTPAELDVAIQSDANAFVFFFDTSEKIVRQQMTFDAYGYPADYMQTYVPKLTAVTGEAVREAAAAKLHPDAMVYLIVGQVGPALRAELEKLGPVTEIDDAQLRNAWL